MLLRVLARRQVQALGEVVCRAEVRERPPPPPPARTYALLRPGAPDAVRTVALLAAWLGSGAGQVLGALDRRNALRSRDDLAVRARAYFGTMHHRVADLERLGCSAVLQLCTCACKSSWCQASDRA